eukprot:CAMPEP_0174385158 /NCGR_PEP_ID=MMETSP0811_2-20130205/126407_1 /TAXON_ID=73025 ORGANISM="Eutreptiella gymnastica-like, Strain CCMP1594" /NCGR_SAMPLE_ID=MMETSP0811_2 /ASSEMBLY_ACC=CAM_ASM_000667 /LENGTH=324 /DNA_ID=CAMNT_0015539375 /DNA_START=43 /DNA_END=1017 /DNA_ORIENTATION=-
MSSVEFGKLLIGAGGIYVCFLSYGSLQEDVTSYVAPSGDRFVYPWFLQVLEAFMNIIFGGLLAVVWEGGPRRVPQKEYAISGAVQVTAKYCTTAAMIAGVSFPVATLAKSSKMIPVMVGSLLLGNAKYSLREYVHVFLIVLGTVLVGLAKKSKPGAPSSLWGILFLVGSLVCDGVVGGEQRKLKAKMQSVGLKERNFEMQFYTNFYMGITALGFAVALQEALPGLRFCLANPEVFMAIGKFAVCSAAGQGFIFFTISTFDSLVSTTVTTTRKIFSVLLSIFTKGHQLNSQGWLGIGLAFLGILGELEEKVSANRKKMSAEQKQA